MPIIKSHPEDDLIRYADGELGQTERIEMEQHLAACGSCRELLSFVQDFKGGLGELKAEEAAPKGPCPDSWTLVSYEAGELDETTARQLRVHLLFCDECQQEFYTLRRARGSNLTRIILRAVEGLLKCVSITGSGELSEPLTAAAGTLRGEPASEAGTVHVETGVRDPKTGTTATLRLRVEAHPRKPEVTVALEAEPLEPGWKASLLDAQEQEVTSVPLVEVRTMVAAGLPHGSYALNVSKGQVNLASFDLDIRAR
jgi:anti-sigma factor RsiW